MIWILQPSFIRHYEIIPLGTHSADDQCGGNAEGTLADVGSVLRRALEIFM